LKSELPDEGVQLLGSPKIPSAPAEMIWKLPGLTNWEAELRYGLTPWLESVEPYLEYRFVE
jgi:hypothetical protein